MEPFYRDSLATLYHGDARDVLAELPPDSVHCIVTSPPYWALRDYGLPPSVWGGNPACEHEWIDATWRDSRLNDDTAGPKQRSDNGSLDHDRRERPGAFCRHCGAWLGCLGLEPTPELFVAHMVEVVMAAVRVLRPDGVLWLNIGDSFAGSGKGQNKDGSHVGGAKQRTSQGTMVGNLPTMRTPGWRAGAGRADGVVDERSQRNRNGTPTLPGSDIKPLDMVGVPWALAFALRAEGLYLRRDVIWEKPNPMPESVNAWRWERHQRKVKADQGWRDEARAKDGPVETSVNHLAGGNTGLSGRTDLKWEDCPGCRVCTPNDGLILRKGAWRPTTSHEYLFMLTKTDTYYCDMEAVRERGTSGPSDQRKMAEGQDRLNPEHKYAGMWEGVGQPSGNGGRISQKRGVGSVNRNLRSFWRIGTQPRKDAHFATFPDRLAETCIRAGTSEAGCCPTCGAPLVRILEPTAEYAALLGKSWHEHEADGTEYGKRHASGGPPPVPEESYRTVGWRASCKCGAGYAVPCTVLDPFVGSGTTADRAKALVRRGIGIDLSEKYLKIAARRVRRTQAGFQVSADAFWDGGTLDEQPDDGEEKPLWPDEDELDAGGDRSGPLGPLPEMGGGYEYPLPLEAAAGQAGSGLGEGAGEALV